MGEIVLKIPRAATISCCITHRIVHPSSQRWNLWQEQVDTGVSSHFRFDQKCVLVAEGKIPS